jgi:hypothetical protein
MACGDDLKNQLSRYVDGELSSEERARVDEHVAACAPCRELLQIFQKNESLLSNALSTESFGNAVIESVLSEIKREAQPIEARPVEEGATEWVRSRPLLPLAAAALLVVGLAVVLNASHNREIQKVNDQIATLTEKVRAAAETISKTAEEYERTIAGYRVEIAMKGAPERQPILLYMAPQQLLVRASFDPKLYGAYDVLRRGEGQPNDQYVKLNDRRLESPEYFDSSVKPGAAYVYKFRAYRSGKNDDFVESLPVTMRLPRAQEYAVEKTIRVQCVEIAVTHKVAKFLLHRVVNGRTVSQEFVINPGDRLGELRQVAGLGNVDFRTNLTLEKLEDGNQTLPIRYTRAALDANGKEQIRSFRDGTVELLTEEVDGVLSIRPNRRALFRTASAAQPDVDIWGGSWMQVRAQE